MILTGRDADRAERGRRRDRRRHRGHRARPGRARTSWPRPLAGIGPVDHLVLAGDRPRPEHRRRATTSRRRRTWCTMKLVGYTEVVHTLLDRHARRRRRSCCSAGRPRSGPTRARPPSRRSTAASSGLVHALAVELAPSGSTRSTPGSSATARSGPARTPRPTAVRDRTPTGRLRHHGRHRRRRRLPAAQPVGQRRRPVRRRRVAAAVNVAVVGTGRMGAAMVGPAPRRRARPGGRAQPHRGQGASRSPTRTGARSPRQPREAVAERRRRGRVARRRRGGARGVRAATDGIIAGLRAGRGRLRHQHRRPGHRARARRRGRRARRDAARHPGLRQRLGRRGGRAHRHGRRATRTPSTGPGRCSTSMATRVVHLGRGRRRRRR